jgi:hypothetical protein
MMMGHFPPPTKIKGNINIILIREKKK